MYRYLLILLVLVQVWAINAANLAPEHELQRLLIVAKESLDANDNEQARSTLNKIDQLGIDPGIDYFYFLGQLEANTGNRGTAKAALINYVNQAGKEGEYYQRALRLITSVENEVEDQATKPASVDMGDVLVSEGDEYINRLQRLYLTNQPIQALTEHVNSILAENVYVPGRIRRPGTNEGLIYKVSTNSIQELVVQESDYRSERPGHSMQRLPVFGVDPYINSDCDSISRSCWLYHPLDQRRWITIAERPAALAELSKALTQLIRQLQN